MKNLSVMKYSYVLSHLHLLNGFFDMVDTDTQLKHLKKMRNEDKQGKASEIIRNHIGFSLGAAAFTPVPGADLLAVSAVQLNMLRQLAGLYNVSFIGSIGKNVITAIVGSGTARIAASLVKAIPGVGTIVGALLSSTLAGASTYALGHVIAAHFQKGGTLDDIDFSLAKQKYEQEIETGKKVAEEMRTAAPSAADETTATMDKITKLSEMHKSGILTDEEFQQMKTKLLGQL
jgi:uncharacterized protein (DUF697 family)